MTIGIGRLSNGGSIALFPFREHGWLSAFASRPTPIDVTAPTDRMDKRRPKSGSNPSDRTRDDGDGARPERCPRAGRERLETIDARIHVATEHDPVTAGYGTFANETTSAVTVVGFDCPAFDRVEMRMSMTIGDVTVLRRMDSLTVLPGDGVEFAPGGRCLMMTGPRGPLEPGQLLGVTVIFSSGRRRLVPFRVKANVPPRRRAGR